MRPLGAIALAAMLAGCAGVQSGAVAADVAADVHAAVASPDVSSRQDAQTGSQHAGDRSVNVGSVNMAGSTVALVVIAAGGCLACWLWRRDRKALDFAVRNQMPRAAEAAWKDRTQLDAYKAGVEPALNRSVKRVKRRAKQALRSDQ